MHFARKGMRYAFIGSAYTAQGYFYFVDLACKPESTLMKPHSQIVLFSYLIDDLAGDAGCKGRNLHMTSRNFICFFNRLVNIQAGYPSDNRSCGLFLTAPGFQ